MGKHDCIAFDRGLEKCSAEKRQRSPTAQKGVTK
jgi:hypothetical protein